MNLAFLVFAYNSVFVGFCKSKFLDYKIVVVNGLNESLLGLFFYLSTAE